MRIALEGVTMERLLFRLREMADQAADEEAAHGEADEILLAALRLMGASEVADAYVAAREKIGFWYA